MQSNILSLCGDKRAEFRIIRSGSATIPAAPAFMYGPVPTETMDRYFKHNHLHPIGVYVRNDVRLSDGFLVQDAEGFRSIEHANIHAPYCEKLIGTSAGLRGLARECKGTSALIAGPGLTIYGHWLVDLLPKLVILEAAGFPLAALRFPLPRFVPKYAVQWLELLGIFPEQIVFYERQEALKVECLLIPTTLHNGVKVSSFFREVSDYFRDKLGVERIQSTNRRLFLSRSAGSQSRKLKNRVDIEAMALNSNLEMIHPEVLPIQDQVKMFASARELVGEYGSALHGSIFSPASASVCCLRGSEFHPGFIQSGLGDVLKQRTGYVFGLTDPESNEHAFEVPTNAFREYLEHRAMVLDDDHRESRERNAT